MTGRARWTVLGLLPAAAVAAAAVCAWLLLPDPGPLLRDNPRSTAYMMRKCPAGHPLHWTPYADISPLLIRAVLQAEDSAFFRHGAVSLAGLRGALQENLRRRSLYWGGSTITMQLARNLYLRPERTLTRKAAEILLAHKLERALTKVRILEIYLNVAEWGPCVFGVRAASRHYFRKDPAELAPQEAAFLASILPGPSLEHRPALTRRFDDKGEVLFESLVRSCLPAQRPGNDFETCQERLGPEDASAVDEIVLELFVRFGGALAGGNPVPLSAADLLQALSEPRRTQAEAILGRLLPADGPEPPGAAGGAPSGPLAVWAQEQRTGAVRYRLPEEVRASLERLMERARRDRVPLRVRAAFQGEGYRAYEALRELRGQGYCLSRTRRLLAEARGGGRSTFEPDAVCFGPAAAEEADPAENNGRSCAGVVGWLLRNAPAFGFVQPVPAGTAGYARQDPWLWQHVSGPPAIRPRPETSAHFLHTSCPTRYGCPA